MAEQIQVRGEWFIITVISDGAGGYTAQTEGDRLNATGLGATIDDAVQDITAAIELLLDEMAPAGDVA